MAATLLRWLGIAWLTLAVGLIVLGYVGIAISEGLGRLLDVLSLFNVAGYLGVLLTLAPGLLLLEGAKRLRERAERKARRQRVAQSAQQ